MVTLRSRACVVAKWVALAAVIGPGGAAAHARQLSEHGVAADESSQPIQLGFGCHTTGAGIAPSTDFDQYLFFASAGERIWLPVRSTSGCYDARLVVRQLSGNGLPLAGYPTILNGGCSGHDQFGNCIVCSMLPSVTVASTGLFEVTLDDSGNNNTGNYHLSVERVPSPIAAELPRGVTMRVVIDRPGDVDQLSFDARAGAMHRIIAASASACVSVRYQVYGPSGALLAGADRSCAGRDQFGNCIVCSVQPYEFVTPTTGTYTLVVWDDGLEDPGNIDVSLQCIGGNCASTPPNDDCFSAATVLAGPTAFSTRGATNESYGGGILNDVWFVYQATCNATLSVSTLGDAGFNTKVGIYATDNCDEIDAPDAVNDDFRMTAWGTDSLARLRDVTAGERYVIRVGSPDGATGTGRLTVACQWRCDWRTDGLLNSQDYFDFTSCLFDDGCFADYNLDRVENSQDFFDFLQCLFNGGD